MTDATVTPGTETTSTNGAAPVATKVRKPKAKAKKAAKTTKKAAKKATKPAPRPVKEGLRRFQERALKALKLGKLSLPQISKKAGISEVVLRRGIGPVDSTLVAKFDKEQGFPCLQTLGLIKVDIDVGSNGSETTYVLTAKGRKAADKIEKLPPVHPSPYDK